MLYVYVSNFSPLSLSHAIFPPSASFPSPYRTHTISHPVFRCCVCLLIKRKNGGAPEDRQQLFVFCFTVPSRHIALNTHNTTPYILFFIYIFTFQISASLTRFVRVFPPFAFRCFAFPFACLLPIHHHPHGFMYRTKAYALGEGTGISAISGMKLDGEIVSFVVGLSRFSAPAQFNLNFNA